MGSQGNIKDLKLGSISPFITYIIYQTTNHLNPMQKKIRQEEEKRQPKAKVSTTPSHNKTYPTIPYPNHHSVDTFSSQARKEPAPNTTQCKVKNRAATEVPG
jgi:hypothetical protein